MRLIQLTMTGSRIEVTPVANPGNLTYASILIIQNNGANQMRIGDNTVSATRGIVLTPTGSLDAQPFLIRGTILQQWYVIGTSGDVADILYEDSN